MKTMKRFLSMAALALAGAIITACSGSDDTIADATPQPENTGKVVTLKTTVGFDDGGATTRALTAGGVKTFAVGETMALVYTNTSGGTVVVPSEALTDGNIAADGKSATFTFNLTEEPNKNLSVKYIYPAAMAMADGNENYDALLTEQDGTLTKLASNFDLATAYNLDWVNGNLPGASLTNQLAILAIDLKDAAGSSITATLSEAVIDVSLPDDPDLNHTYTVSPQSPAATFAEGPIYVAIVPTDSDNYGADIFVTATDGSNDYVKVLNGKPYAKGNIYNLGWRMAKALAVSHDGGQYTTVTGDITLQDGDELTGTLGAKYKISIADGATVTLDGVTIDGMHSEDCPWAGITCLGDATINLKEGTTNTVKGLRWDYPGIYVPTEHTLTIGGTGTLDAQSNGSGAGIGGGEGKDCGNIVIDGGIITAMSEECGAGIGCAIDSSCGDITITGGTVTATGGDGAAGIGCAIDSSCGDITITGGTVTAKGSDGAAGIGSGYGENQKSICGAISISGGTVTATGGEGGAGIGSGSGNYDDLGIYSCGKIEITGGNIIATGGDYAAGIGSGHLSKCGEISMRSCTVEAMGGYLAAGIGTGENGRCGSITIISVIMVKVWKNGGALYEFEEDIYMAFDSIGAGSEGSNGKLTLGEQGKIYQIRVSPVVIIGNNVYW